MYTLKFSLKTEDEELALELKKIEPDCQVSIIKSTGLVGISEIIIAIIAATPSIITIVANIIKDYRQKNIGKTFTIKIENEEHTYTGYSIEEIKEIEELFSNHINEAN